MPQRRTDPSGSALVRLLARIAEVEPPESPPHFADRFSQWLRWTDAISLSTALNGAGPARAVAPLPAARDAWVQAVHDECARVRAALTDAIAQDPLWAAQPPAAPPSRRHGHGLAHGGGAAALAPDAGDFAPHRLRYQTRQQAMDAAIGPLRETLREGLARRSPELARLAALDRVMEQVLGEPQRRLLGALPGVLERRHQRLRGAPPTPEADAAEPQPAWLRRFAQEAQTLAHAELELRLEPVEGLLQALAQPS